MIIALCAASGRLQPIENPDEASLAKAVWIDLIEPTDAEKALVQRVTKLRVASADDLREIETSSRIAEQEGVLYLSMPLVNLVERDQAQTWPLGFVLSRERLITVRFARSPAFKVLHDRAPALDEGHGSGAHLLVLLLEIVVDRLADEMERMHDKLDATSHEIFHSGAGNGRAPRREEAALRATLHTVGRASDLVSRIRDSLLGVARIVPFVAQTATGWLPGDLKPRLKTLRQDVGSLSDYDTHLSEKIQFLLDATLGYINIAQNNLMKVFTVWTVVGIPPVLIAGIYGMNFKVIPELEWAWGYPYSLALIVVSALIPLAIFRLRGWF